MKSRKQALPKAVSKAAWQKQRDKLLAKEKAHMKASDALAAERRRMPMVKVDKTYTFEGPDGRRVKLADLFDGRRQLLLYHFMFAPDDAQGCPGCSLMLDNFCHPSHLNARDVSLAVVSRAPQKKLKPFKKRMGWTLPWYSSFGTDFNADFGVTTDKGEHPAMSVFLRDGKDIYHTYFVTNRGLEALGTVWSLFDILPFGRQESWEKSPAGWPQTPPYQWWRHHDKYEESAKKLRRSR